MEHTYPRITSEEGRKAPEGKYRVILNDRGENRALYFVKDCDTAEEAICLAETFREKDQNGIVQDNKGWVIYPWYDGHQLRTHEDLLKSYGQKCVDIATVKQHSRIPGWKTGDRLVVFWSDVQEATGARARPGDF